MIGGIDTAIDGCDRKTGALGRTQRFDTGRVGWSRFRMTRHHEVGAEYSDTALDLLRRQVMSLRVEQANLMTGVDQRPADAQEPEGDLMADAARG